MKGRSVERPTPSRGKPWRGRLFLWEGRALYAGHAYDTSEHAHNAVQVCIARTDPFRLRAGIEARWCHQEAAIIASNQVHQIDGCGNELVLIYVDPQSSAGRALDDVAVEEGSVGSAATEMVAALRPQLERLVEPVTTAEEATELSGRLLDALLPSGDPRSGRPAQDPRIRRALAVIADIPDRKTTLPVLAARVGLSPSRFAHLFKEHAAMPLHRYLLWLRLQDALRALSGGGTLTEAAHAAGFADSAHLSRTFRTMFGIAPSTLAAGSEFFAA